MRVLQDIELFMPCYEKLKHSLSQLKIICLSPLIRNQVLGIGKFKSPFNEIEFDMPSQLY